MSFAALTSPTNEAVKNVVRLHSARERKDQQLFIIEGLRAISTALSAGLMLDKLYCTQEELEQIRSIVPNSKLALVSPLVMKKMSTAATPSGILAVFKIPAPPRLENLTSGLVLAQIHDPGNMGTLIRTAAACGIKSIVVVEGVDPWSPKVVQASAGTIALVRIFQWDWHTLIRNKKSLRLYGLAVSGGAALSSLDFKQALIVVGNEARGIPAEWLQECDESVTLPMPGGTESLNAAIAGSIALYLAFCSHP